MHVQQATYANELHVNVQHNFVIELDSTNHSQKNERTSEYLLDKERCIKEQIFFELLDVSCI